ncbi:leucyl/phenylalanyl-tRNA--protein transferase [Arenibacter sp. GZD96]|uniref:leucyl/phenylalanyl-tRNA--protein transferase n=1 Tax=Aurantibrevibacter litoralis TaxID=3106030 RepID=UPI002AFF22A7|nr:leucyl/phenylalanyl-tRNA--protein transferase [Arenibacter sp. GZD-96]MEA1787191.1 leucyl/phenylalanyl-tRNA--protein transferase [Arenibacter sp. GZD-96]
MKTEGSKQTITFLTERLWFPSVEHATSDGLVAVGGDLDPERILAAYQKGIFPWYSADSPILWWSPDPRMVLYPEEIRVSKSMQKVIHSRQFELTQNRCFSEVLEQCASVPRTGQEGTWLSAEMKTAYLRLFHMGWAKSYEVWQNGTLVGGLYGLDLGHVFCGESMFSSTSNASKFALIKLAQHLQHKNYHLIDCQMYTPHLERMGARSIARKYFLDVLQKGT